MPVYSEHYWLNFFPRQRQCRIVSSLSLCIVRDILNGDLTNPLKLPELRQNNCKYRWIIQAAAGPGTRPIRRDSLQNYDAKICAMRFLSSNPYRLNILPSSTTLWPPEPLLTNWQKHWSCQGSAGWMSGLAPERRIVKFGNIWKLPACFLSPFGEMIPLCTWNKLDKANRTETSEKNQMFKLAEKQSA